jgi:hypothetical protein
LEASCDGSIKHFHTAAIGVELSHNIAPQRFGSACRTQKVGGKSMKNTKFVVKVNRGGTLGPVYVQRIDHTPIQTTTNRKLALKMGKLTAEDAVKAIQNSRCNPELVSVSASD